jgi:hypothetical protein
MAAQLFSHDPNMSQVYMKLLCFQTLALSEYFSFSAYYFISLIKFFTTIRCHKPQTIDMAAIGIENAQRHLLVT